MLTVHVNRSEVAEAASREEVLRVARAVARAEGISSGEISITFLEAPAMAALNEAHLDRAGPSDVIAFNLGALHEPLGDIYVCPEVARESAAELGIELREELLRLVVHGLLHVFGYDHPDGADRETSEMFQRQEELLRRLL